MHGSDRLQAVLERLDLIEYADIFRKEKIDDGNLHLLTEGYLREINIPLGPALQIMGCVERFETHTGRIVTCNVATAAFGWRSVCHKRGSTSDNGTLLRSRTINRTNSSAWQ